MKTVQLNFSELDLEIDFDFIEGEKETRETPEILESVYIYKIRLHTGWEVQDSIPQKHLAMIKEMLLERNYVEQASKRITEDLFKLFGEILNPTK